LKELDEGTGIMHEEAKKTVEPMAKIIWSPGVYLKIYEDIEGVHYLILTNRISKIKGSFSVSLIRCYNVTSHNNSSFCLKKLVRDPFSL
jgi:hypothetical protein